jgi:hypothetical protein
VGKILGRRRARRRSSRRDAGNDQDITTELTVGGRIVYGGHHSGVRGPMASALMVHFFLNTVSRSV